MIYLIEQIDRNIHVARKESFDRAFGGDNSLLIPSLLRYYPPYFTDRPREGLRGVPGPDEGVGGDLGGRTRSHEHQRRAAGEAGAVSFGGEDGCMLR